MTTSLSDTDSLITQAGGGDRSAERELFERYRARLRRMISIRMDPRLTARFDPSDVVQEALLTASVQLPAYAAKRPVPFYPWLRNVAWQRLVDLHHHHFTAQRRSVVREVAMQLPDESALKLAGPLMASSSSPSEILIRKELCARVQTALEDLPTSDREVLVMRHLERMSVSEIAATLEISESAVKMRRLRAVKKFKDLLSGE